MSRLWHCVVEVELVVQADTEGEAVSLAEEHARDELADGGDADITVIELKSAKTVPFEFADSLPWGGDGVSTVEQILKARGP